MTTSELLENFTKRLNDVQSGLATKALRTRTSALHGRDDTKASPAEQFSEASSHFAWIQNPDRDFVATYGSITIHRPNADFRAWSIIGLRACEFQAELW